MSTFEEISKGNLAKLRERSETAQAARSADPSAIEQNERNRCASFLERMSRRWNGDYPAVATALRSYAAAVRAGDYSG